MLARYKMATEGEVSLTFLFGPWSARNFPPIDTQLGLTARGSNHHLGFSSVLFLSPRPIKKKNNKKKMLHCTLLSVVLGVSGMFLEMLILFQIKITW